MHRHGEPFNVAVGSLFASAHPMGGQCWGLPGQRGPSRSYIERQGHCEASSGHAAPSSPPFPPNSFYCKAMVPFNQGLEGGCRPLSHIWVRIRSGERGSVNPPLLHIKGGLGSQVRKMEMQRWGGDVWQRHVRGFKTKRENAQQPEIILGQNILKIMRRHQSKRSSPAHYHFSAVWSGRHMFSKQLTLCLFLSRKSISQIYFLLQLLLLLLLLLFFFIIIKCKGVDYALEAFQIMQKSYDSLCDSA